MKKLMIALLALGIISSVTGVRDNIQRCRRELCCRYGIFVW